MQSTFTDQSSPDLFRLVFDKSLTCIYTAQAVRDETGKLIDFRIQLTNESFRQQTGFSDAKLQAQTLLTHFPVYGEQELFGQMRQVVETGEDWRTPDWSICKLGDGVVVNFIVITSDKETEQASQQQAQLIESIFNDSVNGQFAMQAIRDEQNVITDFWVVAANRVAAQLTRQPVEAIIGKPFNELFPGYKPAGLFDQYKRTIETGQQQETELYYPYENVDGWYWVGSEPFGDGVIQTFLDITDRKKAEQEVKQQTELLQTIIDSMQTGMNLLSPVYSPDEAPESGTLTGRKPIDFRYELVNTTVAAYVGQQPDALKGTRVSDWFPAYFANGDFDTYRQVYETGQPRQYDHHYVGDGQDVWISVAAQVLGPYLLMTFTDFTNVKQAELLAQQQAEQLQATLDASISSIIAMTAIRDESGQIIDFSMDQVNGAVEQSLGQTPDELEGRTLLSMYPGNIESGFFDLYVKATDTGIPQKGTYHYTDENGFDGWFEASAVQQATDKVVITFLNVTESKQNEQKIQQQSDLLQSVLNATTTTFATYQPIRDEQQRIVNFRFTLANQEALAVVGLTADELYTKTILDVSPDLLGSKTFADYVQVVETGETITFERNFKNRCFLATAVRFGEDGLLTSSIDITEIKQAREQLVQMNARLQRSNESLDQFASVASHDLQEPLRKIKSFGDVLRDQYGPALGEGVDLLERMQSAAGRMQTLIRDLLTYSRLAKSGAVPHQPLDLNRIVAEVLVDLELAVTEKGAIVDVGTLGIVPGDALQLRQVIQNLLSNALKFTKPGRQPRISVNCRVVSAAELPDGLIRINPSGSSAYLVVTVADNGIGFGAAYREKIFGAFERLHGKNSPYGGTGIGLAIVRRVVENHHGAVTAHSGEGEGATFTLYFPAAG